MVGVACGGALLERIVERSTDVHVDDRPEAQHVIFGIALVARQARRLAGALDPGAVEVAIGTPDQRRVQAFRARVYEMRTYVERTLGLERQRCVARRARVSVAGRQTMSDPREIGPTLMAAAAGSSVEVR